MRRDIVFLHIPKTAGTSLRTSLEMIATEHRVLRDYGNSSATSPEIAELVRDGHTKEFRAIFNQERNGIFLSGHFPAARYWPHFHAESFVTFVRDPIDRVLSEYNHFVNHYGWTASFDEFVAAPRFRNVMSRHLADIDLEAFGFIGFVDSYDSQLLHLSKFLQASLQPKRQNTGIYRAAGSEDACLSRRELVASYNREDIALYATLRAQRQARPSARTFDAPPTTGYRGQVRKKADGSVSGWLFNTVHECLCEVEILQDGAVIGTTKAERFRDVTKKQQKSRTGLCGFRIGPAGLLAMNVKVGADLIFRAKGSAFILQGSPVQL